MPFESGVTIIHSDVIEGDGSGLIAVAGNATLSLSGIRHPPTEQLFTTSSAILSSISSGRSPSIYTTLSGAALTVLDATLTGRATLNNFSIGLRGFLELTAMGRTASWVACDEGTATGCGYTADNLGVGYHFGGAYQFGNVLVGDGASIALGDAKPDAKYTFTTTLDQSLRQDVSKYAPFPRVALNVTLDLTVATGGALHADGRGFGGGDLAEGPLSETSSVLNISADIASNHRDLSTARGDGAGESAASGGGGGGYGGEGGLGFGSAGFVVHSLQNSTKRSNSGMSNRYGQAYDSAVDPSAWGSGGGAAGRTGGGGRGGGAVKVSIGGDLYLDGRIY